MSEQENLPPENIPNVNDNPSQEEIIETKSENMEVHHHPHVEKKSFKEYLLEGLMIFLAVSMGFIAENVREHISENERAKEFAASLVTDLAGDTAYIQKHIIIRKGIYNNADSLMTLIKYGSLTTDFDKFSRYFRGINVRGILTINRGTIHQLENSGALRYFRNKQLTSFLINYYNRIDEINHRVQYMFDYESANLLPFSREHYDFRYEDTIFRNKKKIMPFRNIDENKQIELYNISRTIGALNRSITEYVLTDAVKKQTR